MTQPKSIKASVGFRKLSAGDVLARANAVLDGVYTAKDDYPNPPVDQATLKAQIDALSAGITAALDGGKKAVTAREHLKEVVIKSLGQLGHYVEANCKDDLQTFLKSGFQPISAVRTPAAPLSESIRKIVPGKNSGQLEVTLVSHTGNGFAVQHRRFLSSIFYANFEANHNLYVVHHRSATSNHQRW